MKKILRRVEITRYVGLPSICKSFVRLGCFYTRFALELRIWRELSNELSHKRFAHREKKFVLGFHPNPSDFVA